MIITGQDRHPDKTIRSYQQYIDHLWQTQDPADTVSQFAKGYEDFLQSPLQVRNACPAGSVVVSGCSFNWLGCCMSYRMVQSHPIVDNCLQFTIHIDIFQLVCVLSMIYIRSVVYILCSTLNLFFSLQLIMSYW